MIHEMVLREDSPRTRSARIYGPRHSRKLRPHTRGPPCPVPCTSREHALLDNGDLQTSQVVVQRGLIETGMLSNDPFGHANYDPIVEGVIGLLAFVGPDPRHADFDDPDYPFQSSLVLASVIGSGRDVSTAAGTAWGPCR